MTGFILIALALSALAALAITAPLWRRSPQGAGKAPSPDLAIYRDQLAEIDRDLARGVLDPAEAERTRTEIARRLLAADSAARPGPEPAPHRLSQGVALAVIAALIGGAGTLYWFYGAPGYQDIPRAVRIAAGEERRATRPSQQEAEALAPDPDTLAQFDLETQNLIRARREAALAAPEDLRAWDVLAQTEAAIGQFQRAAQAQTEVVRLKGEATTEDDLQRLLDLRVAATRGYVSPEAETATLTLLNRNPNSISGLYYAGLLYAQNDRPDRAFALWQRVIESGTPGTLHYDFAVGQIEEVAAQLGREYELPSGRGPSAEDIAAAEGMAPEDREAMIQSMVASLSERLANEGGPPQDWAQLITALSVLGNLEAASSILAEAETVFADNEGGLQILRNAARQAGLRE